MEVIDRYATSRPVQALAQRLLRGGAITQGPAGRGMVALTFDDGPSPDWTPRILDILGEYKARATFFIAGKCVEGNEGIIRRMAAQGHEVATHLWTHNRGTTRDIDAFDRELRRSMAVIEALTGRPVKYLRFPFGEHGVITRRHLQRYGMTAVHWTFSTLDSRVSDRTRLLTRVRALIRDGSIVLMHDNLADDRPIPPPYLEDRSHTVAMLPGVLKTLEQKGLSPVTIGELLE